MSTTSSKRSTDSKQEATKKDKKAKQATPYQAFMDEFNSFQTKHGFTGQMLIKGIPRDDAYDEEGKQEDSSKFTKDQMNGLRYILLNEKRIEALEYAEKLVLGDQYGSSIMMFGTSFSYEVHDLFLGVFKPKYSKMKNWADKFNLLFAVTNSLMENDCWMHDNEGDMGIVVGGMAKMWRALLKKSDEVLGIDSRYTRPGVEAMLEGIQKTVEGYDECYQLGKFKWN